MGLSVSCGGRTEIRRADLVRIAESDRIQSTFVMIIFARRPVVFLIDPIFGALDD
jgi:hypothetical protein